MAKDPKLVRGRTAAPAQNDPADLEKMKTVLGVDMAKDPSFTAAQVFDGARMGLAPKVVLITDPPILTPFGFRKAFLDHFEKLVGETYEQASARMFPLMAEITPKMRRLLRSGDRRKRKRGIRLYWAAPGEHSRGRILMEIDQGNFARSKFLIRGGPVSTTEWRKPFSSLGVEFLPGHGPVRNEAGELDAQKYLDEAIEARLGAIQAGKTALAEREIERARILDPDVKFMVIEPREEK